MSCSLTLDPYLLAVPSPAEGRDTAVAWVESLVTLSVLAQETWLALRSPGGVEVALFEAGCFPALDAVTTLLTQLGVDEFSTEDVASALARVLQSSGEYERDSGLDDVLVDPPCTVVPPIPRPRRRGAVLGEGRDADGIHEASRRLFSMHALVTACAATWVVQRPLVTLDPFCGGAGFTVAGTFTIIERTAGCVLPTLADPYVLSPTRLRAHGTADDGLRALDPVALWIDGDDEAKLAAVQLAVLQRETDAVWVDMERAVTFGCEFVQGLARHGFDRQPGRVRQLIDVCADLVLRSNQRSTHALREGDGPTAPQRMRGDDKAWRMDIDYEFHLHYWERPGRRYELGCVVSHNNFVIPYCR